MNNTKQPSGFSAFIVIWLTQIVSILASGMTGFALSLWMYQKTQSATAMGLMQVFYITPFLIMSPIAGVMVDRYSRKLMMMISDITGGLGTLFILLMFATGKLEFWHLYLAAVLNGIGNTFQWPAYSAAISTIIPKEQLGRVNGLMALMEAGPGVLAPILAGALIPLIKLEGILLFDVVTFLLAISGIGFTVFAPMILARSDQNSVVFGTVQSMFAVGSIAGGLLMSAWGGFKRRTHGVLFGWILSGLGMAAIGLGRNLYWWIPAAIFINLVVPLVNGSNQALWQAKVAPDLQGRVFSARRLIAWFTNPITPIIGGTLADFVLEPGMRAQGGLANTFGWLVGGTGPGTGMSLLMILCGLGAALVGLSGYLIGPVRNAEDLLPDHDQLAPATEPAT